MSHVAIRGTTDPADVAVVLALLARRTAAPRRRDLASWQRGRRAALSPHPPRRRHPEVR